MPSEAMKGLEGGAKIVIGVDKSSLSGADWSAFEAALKSRGLSYSMYWEPSSGRAIAVATIDESMTDDFRQFHEKAGVCIAGVTCQRLI